jgi:hypothetical protein
MANQIRTIGLRQINPTGKSLLIFRNGVKPLLQKYFRLRSTQISSLIRTVPSHRGALRTSRNAGRDAVDAAVSGEQQRAGRMMPKRTAKSCRSDAPMQASSLREAAQATVSNKPGHRGEREVSRKTIARGMPGDFRCDRGDYARVFVFSHTRLRVHRAPGIPCALYFGRGETVFAPRAHRAARSRRRAVIARSAATKQSILSLRGAMDCFAALAMTVPRRAPPYGRHRPRRRAIQYSRDASDGIEKPRRTGYPAGACHRARRRRDPVAGV